MTNRIFICCSAPISSPIALIEQNKSPFTFSFCFLTLPNMRNQTLIYLHIFHKNSFGVPFFLSFHASKKCAQIHGRRWEVGSPSKIRTFEQNQPGSMQITFAKKLTLELVLRPVPPLVLLAAVVDRAAASAETTFRNLRGKWLSFNRYF